jgi:hypothetical protein
MPVIPVTQKSEASTGKRLARSNHNKTNRLWWCVLVIPARKKRGGVGGKGGGGVGGKGGGGGRGEK